MTAFLLENWKFLVAAIGLAIEIVLILVTKRRPKIIDNSFVVRCAEWIKEAESKFLQGKDKLYYVLDCARDYLGSNYDQNTVREIVEWILTIPQKKEK